MALSSKTTTYIEWIVLAVLLIGTFQLFTTFEWFSDVKPDKDFPQYLLWIGLIVVMFLTLAAHELGHLLTGLAQGFRLELYVVGPLGIKREEGKVKVYFNKNLGHYGGVAATSPTSDSPDNAKKFARLILAGPVASLIYAVVCLVLAVIIGKPLGFFLYTSGIISIAIFYATTIPSRTGMFFTDRKRYQRLTTPGKDQDVELAMLRIMAKFSQNNSYQDVDKKDIDELVTDELPFIQFFGLFNLVCYQIEKDKTIAPETEEQYRTVAQGMSANLVTAFDKEIENFKALHL